MKKRKIFVLSATVLLAIVAFPLLATAAQNDAPVLTTESFLLGTSGCQMNLQLFSRDSDIAENGASVGPANVPPPACVVEFGEGTSISCPTCLPPNPYCTWMWNYCTGNNNWYCPPGNPAAPPSGEGSTCTAKAKWLCHNTGSCETGPQVLCAWYLPSEEGSCAPPATARNPTYCPETIIAAAANTQTSSCPFEILNVTNLGTENCQSCLVCTNCNANNICDPANCKIRDNVEQNIVEGYKGSCVYTYTTKTGQTVTKTIPDPCTPQ